VIYQSQGDCLAMVGALEVRLIVKYFEGLLGSLLPELATYNLGFQNFKSVNNVEFVHN